MRVKSAQVFEKGLQYDRRWMLIDEFGMFMTQRVYNEMALFKVEVKDKALKIIFERDSIFLSFDYQVIQTPIQATVWDDTITTFEVSKPLSQWFSKRLNKQCRLVSFPEENPRAVDANYKINSEQVSLADAYPFLIVGQSSLDDLNLRLKEPLPINRFRPNFVFSGGEPYEEDQWRNFKIGKNSFVGVKPCSRCVLTTVNQETGIKGVEPLATLATYRKNMNKIYFGQNVLAIDHYEIHEGDEITF